MARILLVVSNPVSLTPGETAVYVRLASMHTVTLHRDNVSRPSDLDTAYDLLIFGGSVNGTALSSKFGDGEVNIPVLCMGYGAFVFSGVTTHAGAASSGTTGYVIDNSHFITAGLTPGADISLYSSAGARHRAGTGSLTESAQRLISLTSTGQGLGIVTVYEVGVQLANGTMAPARRLICGLADVHLATPAALEILDRSVAWALSLDSSQPEDAPAPPTEVFAEVQGATRVEVSHIDSSDSETHWRYYVAQDQDGVPDAAGIELLKETPTSTKGATGAIVTWLLDNAPADATRWYGVAASGSGGPSEIVWSSEPVLTPPFPTISNIVSPGIGTIVSAGTLVGLSLSGSGYDEIAWYRGDPASGGTLLGTANGAIYDTTGRPEGVETLYARVTNGFGDQVTATRSLVIGAASGGSWDAAAYAIRALGGII